MSKNGGHCQPLIYATKPHLARFELATYQFLENLIAEHDIPCDWHRVGGVHALPTDELVGLAAKKLERLRRDHPDLADKAELFTERGDLDRLRVSHAAGAILQPFAAKCWPYKLVAWVLETLLKENSAEKFSLQTTTPVTHLQKVDGLWVVHTPHGQIAAREVLLATNAYTSHLLPRMSSLIVPVRGQVSALLPPERSQLLKHSYIWLPGESDDYMIQRDEGMIIVGGERLSVPDGGQGIWKDDEIDDEVARRLRRSLHSAVKLNSTESPKEEEDKEELDAFLEWTGIMGYSKDGHPWVGRVPTVFGGEDGGGLWICGGYTGHGMPVAARCAVAVAEMILGKEDGSVEVPKEYLVNVERADMANGMELKRSILDQLRDSMTEP